MPVKNQNYRWLSMVLLSLVFIVHHGCDRKGQEQDSEAATVKLKVPSEAMDADDIAEVHALVKAGADLNVRNKYGVTPLWMASQDGHIEIVNLLLANQADINAAHKTGATSLWIASQNGHTEVVELLLSNKADVNAIDKDGRTPLWIASRIGHTEVVELLLSNKADVDTANIAHGNTPLLLASGYGHVEVVKLLLANKAYVNAAHKSHGSTPLIMASQSGHTDVVKLLLAAGANVHAKANMRGKFYTVLAIAKARGHTEIARLLSEYTAKEYSSNMKPLLKLDGVYQSDKLEYGWHYIRFYEDRTVITVSSSDTAVQVASWFKYENITGNRISHGLYENNGGRLVFSSTSAQGTVDYEGTILDNALNLDSYSHINSHRGKRTYHFVQLSEE